MFWFWVAMFGIVYFVLLAMALVFFAGVSKVNRHWERVFHESQEACDEHWHRAA